MRVVKSKYRGKIKSFPSGTMEENLAHRIFPICLNVFIRDKTETAEQGLPSQKKSLKCTDGNLVRKMTGMAYVYQWYATVNLGTIRFTASSLLRCCKIWNQERIRMINNLMYIELKMGYSDDDPAWIGYVKTSKSRIKIFVKRF